MVPFRLLPEVGQKQFPYTNTHNLTVFTLHYLMLFVFHFFQLHLRCFIINVAVVHFVIPINHQNANIL